MVIEFSYSSIVKRLVHQHLIDFDELEDYAKFLELNALLRLPFREKAFCLVKR